MAAVTERFVLRMSTTAKADRGAAAEIKGVPLRIVERKLTLQAKGAVVSHV
jgi:hypothetical protein